ncbi:MAG: type II secretion system protein [Acidobacteria bacterium]|nr:type II secretion system protein [Acidobacteriota bacterium]
MPYCAYCGSDVRDPARFNCPSCGNPHNGAPPPAPIQNAGETKAVSIVLILVVVGLFVVAFVGILAAIAIPNLLTAMQRSKQKRTMADMRTVATAIEARATDTNQYPRVTSYSELGPQLVPTYMKTLPALDGWSHGLRYECWDANNSGVCDSYAFGSGGKDGAFEHASLRDYSEDTSTTNFDCDIVYGNGKFVQWPSGTTSR